MYCPNGNYNPYAINSLALQSSILNQNNLQVQIDLINASGSLALVESNFANRSNCCGYITPTTLRNYTPNATCCNS